MLLDLNVPLKAGAALEAWRAAARRGRLQKPSGGAHPTPSAPEAGAVSHKLTPAFPATWQPYF